MRDGRRPTAGRAVGPDPSAGTLHGLTEQADRDPARHRRWNRRRVLTTIEAHTDSDSDSNTNSHDVSDPSGHARDGIQRASRGRSRHGSSLGALVVRLQGRHRTPPNGLRTLVMRAEVMPVQPVGVAGRTQAATAAPILQTSAGASHGDNLRNSGCPLGRPQPLRREGGIERDENWPAGPIDAWATRGRTAGNAMPSSSISAWGLPVSESPPVNSSGDANQG